ncbi:helix-turn-helix transcriptional regulator [Sporomusa sphaeroides]|uniref:helix-turn-helix domain-containing protein n=1 Tax=Sporomusa sphaeroides TaxID=47679 RepID=UPI003158099F
MIDKEIFANRLKNMRNLYQLSMSELAQNIGLKSKGAINQFEKGLNLPSLETLVAISDYFIVSLDYLTGRNDDPQYEIYLPKAENALLADMSEPFIQLFYYAKSKGLKKELITYKENWVLIRWFEEWKQSTQEYIDYYAKLKEYERNEDEKYKIKQMEKNPNSLRPILPRATGFLDSIKRDLSVKKPTIELYDNKTAEDMQRDDILTRNLQRLINVNIGIGEATYFPIPNDLSKYLLPITESDIKDLTEAYIKQIGD